MNKILFFIATMLLLVACKDKPTYVKLATTQGDIIIRLYDETPLHKANFEKLVEEDYYDGVLFHRVINEFMIQTGDPKSKDAKPGQMLGDGGPDYKVDAEFRDSIFHKKGAIAAARDNNPAKASSGSQFYIVEGKTFTDKELNQIEKRYDKTFTQEQREYYKKIGGTPFLDQNYTVFGEVVVGMNVVEKISDVETDRKDRPKEDVRVIEAEIIKYKEK